VFGLKINRGGSNGSGGKRRHWSVMEEWKPVATISYLEHESLVLITTMLNYGSKGFASKAFA
jgi:hypothetical protein